MLIRGLPPDSATRQSFNKGKPLPTLTEIILADIFDATQHTTYAVANKNVPREKQSQPPKPYPRPWAEERKSKITAAALLAFRERTRRE